MLSPAFQYTIGLGRLGGEAQVDLNLGGRTVLVTGASKGIGLGIAQWFAREGCHLRLAARSGDLLEKEAAALRKSCAVDARTFALDLSREDARCKLAEACPDVDVLVNNAGDIPAGSIEDVGDAAWRAGWELKVFGYIDLTRHYLARMKARRAGVIVNVIGTAGERPMPAYVAGSMGNAALMSLTVALGAASPEFGVRVLGVNPGPVLTERIVKISKKRAGAMFGDEARYPELMQKNPFGRPASVDEIAATVVFLASERSSYTSGTIVTIDGGFSKRPAL
jgi:NAD(P)-dependent dehydrogenase (short-subunit alcohol dehydrogenase family)